MPFLGICFGMQLACVEFARNVCGLPDAMTTEVDETTPDPVIDFMPEQRSLEMMGGTMRLGAYDCTLEAGTLAARAYGELEISERHRHRYEFNNRYRPMFEEHGMRFSRPPLRSARRGWSRSSSFRPNCTRGSSARRRIRSSSRGRTRRRRSIATSSARRWRTRQGALRARRSRRRARRLPDPGVITVVVLTRDEERNLPRALASVPRGIAMLVLDAESRDDTAQIARSAGATGRQRAVDGVRRRSALCAGAGRDAVDADARRRRGARRRPARRDRAAQPADVDGVSAAADDVFLRPADAASGATNRCCACFARERARSTRIRPPAASADLHEALVVRRRGRRTGRDAAPLFVSDVASVPREVRALHDARSARMRARPVGVCAPGARDRSPGSPGCSVARGGWRDGWRGWYVAYHSARVSGRRGAKGAVRVSDERRARRTRCAADAADVGRDEGVRARARRALAARRAGYATLTFTRGGNFGWRRADRAAACVRRARLDLVHYLALYVPLDVPRPFVVTIHDLIHLRFPQYFKAKVGPYYATVVRGVRARRARHHRRRAHGRRSGDASSASTAQGARHSAGRRRAFSRSRARRTPAAAAVHALRRQPSPAQGPGDALRRVVGAAGRARRRSLRDRTDDFGGELAAAQRGERRSSALGDVTVERLARITPARAALVHPALREGFGLPMLEAMAAGAPVDRVRGSVPALLEAAALTFPARDWRRLARAARGAAHRPGSSATRVGQLRACGRAPTTWDRCAPRPPRCIGRCWRKSG